MNETKKLSELLPITEATTEALRKLGENYNFAITCQDFMPDGSLSEELTTKNVSVSELEVAAKLAGWNDLRLLVPRLTMWHPFFVYNEFYKEMDTTYSIRIWDNDSGERPRHLDGGGL